MGSWKRISTGKLNEIGCRQFTSYNFSVLYILVQIVVIMASNKTIFLAIKKFFWIIFLNIFYYLNVCSMCFRNWIWEYWNNLFQCLNIYSLKMRKIEKFDYVHFSVHYMKTFKKTSLKSNHIESANRIIFSEKDSGVDSQFNYLFTWKEDHCISVFTPLNDLKD